MSSVLHNDCCLEVMKGMEDCSIDAIITDPPYYSTNLHFDKAEKIDYQAFLVECKRLLKPNGVLVSFADFNLLAELRSYKVFKSAYELIWQKNRAANFALANKMPMRVHEYIGIFKDKQGTYNKQRILRSELSLKRDPIGSNRWIKACGTNAIIGTERKGHLHNYKEDGLKNPVSVLPFKVPQGNYGAAKHPTQKPLDLLEWLVKTYSNEGDLILDPFAGSGTTGAACIKLKRDFIGIELNPDYFAIAQERIAHAEHDLINLFT